MDSTSIGLDIGSSAVRAAEITSGRDGRHLRRYAQVGLPAGAVVDGEIVNDRVVSEALRRLWVEAGFSTNKVILGVAGHRVIVRQADVPALDEEELRSSLRFDAQELIPIPMEQASFDFTILDRNAGTDENGRSTMRILIVAAHRDLLRSHLAALKGAGLEAVAIDAASLALMRVVPPTAGDAPGAEALVAIGAELTTVAVRQNGVLGFIRSVSAGGAKLTAGIANTMHVEPAVAERLKRGAVPGDSPQLVQARRAVAVDLRDLADEVKATVDFFVGQSDGVPVTRVLLTGGAAQTQGLVEALAGGMNAEVRRIDPFAAVDITGLDLDEPQRERARASAATAVGLALWTYEAPANRLSVLPEEVLATRRARRVMTLAALGLVVVIALLVVGAIGQVLAVNSARDQVKSTDRQVTVLKADVSKLQLSTAVHGKLIARQGLVVTALTGDIDWVHVLGQLAAVIPRNVSLTAFSGTRTPAGSASSLGIGTLQFSVSGTGGLPVVAAWLEGLQRDQSLQGTWISGISVVGNGGTVTFASTANLTKFADSNRAQAAKR